MLTVTPSPELQGWFNCADGHFHAEVKVMDSPSPYGLLAGRITKVAIYLETFMPMLVFNFDGNVDRDVLDISGRRFLAAVVEHFDGARVRKEEQHA